MEKRRGGAEEVMSPVPDPPQAEEPQPTRHASTASLSLERLPDEALLLVLQYLDVISLLTCRLVCKRLGALALDWDAWRHREVDVRLSSADCVCPELRLAPCLRRLVVSIPMLDGFAACPSAPYAWTRCAATELCLEVSDGSDNALAAAALINRQQALGRLKSLRVELYSSKPAVISVLTETCASTHGLVKLEVEVWGGRLPTPFQTECTISAPSLRHFKCVLSPATEHFVNFILVGHALTLETVDLLGGREPGLDSMACVSTGPLLAKLPKLSKLTCCNIPGVEAVSGGETLTEVNLIVSTESRHRGAVAGAATLLRAGQIRWLSVRCVPPSADVDVDVVRALALSGRSCLESLEIYNNNGEAECSRNFSHLQELMTALPSLCALRHLYVGLESIEKLDKLVLAITPATAPSLQDIHLDLDEGLCAHAWLHRDAFNTLMSRNALLHVRLYAYMLLCCDESCQACTLGCHDQLMDGAYVDIFWHDINETCPLDHGIDHLQWSLSQVTIF
ncbi:uncharacterized protein LOC113214181 isoform X1 [Frankliniella occidentalis]|uniref:Uncharacterized protein LOC113214181 isoform X1 n=1 Tax=Frankliniella occidentalis TaxID=133901 RepID=A0A9C6X6E9_FRAOC|nr:uncharacterized protein LOC113214181 isoform X1 [Frankliniella occidentalis]